MHSATVLDCRKYFRAGLPLCVLFLLLASCDSEPVVASGGGNSSETSNTLLRSVLRSDGSVARGDSITILPELYYADFPLQVLKSNQHFEGVLDSNGNFPEVNLADGRYWLEIHSSHSVLGRIIRYKQNGFFIDTASLQQNSWASWSGSVAYPSSQIDSGSLYILGTKSKAVLGKEGKFQFSRLSMSDKKVAALLSVGNKKYYCVKRVKVLNSKLPEVITFGSKDCIDEKKGAGKGEKSNHSSLLFQDSIPEQSRLAELVNL